MRGLLRVGIVGAGLVAATPFANAASEPTRVRLASALVDDIVRGLLPLDLVLPGPMGGPADGGVPSPAIVAAITELKYCGATDRGSGRFRAVIRTGPFGGAGAPILVGDDGCRQSLADLARHLTIPQAMPAGAAGAVGVADVEAVWRPWELRLVLVRTNAPAPPGPRPPQPLAGLDAAPELLVVSTAGFRLLAGIAEPITVHVAPAFAADGVEVLAVWAEGSSGPPTGRPSGAGALAGAGGGGVATMAGVNAVAELPFVVANQILRHLTATQPLAIRIDRDVVDVHALSVAPAGGPGSGGGGVAVSGLATPRSLRETVRATLHAAGSELRVTSVRAEAQQESCGGQGGLAAAACNARNGARNAAAAALGAGATQRYQGQLVRDLVGPPDLRVDTGGRRLELAGDLLHVGFTGRGISVGARLAAGGRSH